MVKSINYRFDGKVKFVESSESYAAIVTPNSINIISLKVNTGTPSVYLIPDCIDAKWSHQGLYCLQ